MLYKQFNRRSMKSNIQKFRHFLGTPAGIVVLFVLVFYALTFSVYWFYSPGPEERRQAQVEAQTALGSENL